MPWTVGRKTKKGYPIVKKGGKVVGYSKTKEKAKASVRARYASVNNEGKKKVKKRSGYHSMMRGSSMASLGRG